MPRAAPHACHGTACGRRGLAARGERRCPACKAVEAREDNQRRGYANERGYDHRWRRYRKAFLATHPLCAECTRQGRTTPARVVDHVVPHKGDQRLFWDPTNHQALCDYTSTWDCHGRKTALEDGGLGRSARAAS